MNDPKENYKRWHPDQFSDSIIVKKASLGRDFLEYYLSRISSHSQEKDFERFCKAILEAEVCPNLSPQTGPTGGGDSKVDTETYPVAEQLTESWLYGYGDKAGSERWAFAISAKADWLSKIKSDVAKISKTIIDGRQYTKIFFVSNQLISDKKRALAEDKLRSEYNIDIRILSMDWLLDAVFRSESNRQTAVATLGLSENLLDEKQIGEKDYKRQQELNAVECSLKRLADLKSSEIIAAARRSLVLSRELENDMIDILARLDRLNRLAAEYGTIIDQADALYDSAWTMFWWYSSEKHFYEYYQRFETIALKEKTTYLFEKLCTLWMNLFSLCEHESEIDLEWHRRVVESIYNYLISDSSKPNTILSARNSFQVIRLAAGDPIDDIVDDYIDIIQKSEHSLEINVETVAKIIQTIFPYQKAKNYDQLFDLLVSRLSKEKHDSEAAKMIASRGQQLIESDPFKALSLFSKAVLGFHNEANTTLLIQTVFLMAHLYEKIGAYWAARNYYFYVVTYCLNNYMKKGEITLFFPAAANKLKWIELMQGRAIFSTEMHSIEVIARNAYPGTISEDENNFDIFLAFLLFKTPFEKLCHLEKLPQYLDRYALVSSALACRYELGYYDEDWLADCNGDKKIIDCYMKQWANQPAWEQIRYDPWYGFEAESILQSKVMGCTFYAHSTNDMFAIEFAATLLATIECFLSTGFYNDIFSQASSFEIKIIKVPQNEFTINVEYSKKAPTHMSILISEYSKSEFQSAHKLLSDKLIEIISIIVSAILGANEDLQKFKKMLESEFIFARAEVFADSLFYGFSTFGPDAFSFDYVLKKYDEEPLIRSEKAILHEEIPGMVPLQSESREIIYDNLPDYSYKQCKNDEVTVSDVINVPLWNDSLWSGVLYHFCGLPVLSLIFKSDSGLRIFDEWIKKYGEDDANNVIGIRLIKEIDYEHPHWYRVGIGANSPTETQQSTFSINYSRLSTMHPDNDANLTLFQNVQLQHGDFFICPSIIRPDRNSPEIHFEKKILKHSGCLKILNAYDIEKNDVLSAMSIMTTDKPLIPPGYEKSDLIGLLKRSDDLEW